jgi:hypothetical protein
VFDRHLAHGLQDPALRGHVETGGRFVENDHPWAAAESHGDADALLLTTRHLMGIALEEGVRGG